MVTLRAPSLRSFQGEDLPLNEHFRVQSLFFVASRGLKILEHVRSSSYTAVAMGRRTKAYDEEDFDDDEAISIEAEETDEEDADAAPRKPAPSPPKPKGPNAEDKPTKETPTKGDAATAGEGSYNEDFEDSHEERANPAGDNYDEEDFNSEGGGGDDDEGDSTAEEDEPLESTVVVMGEPQPPRDAEET